MINIFADQYLFNIRSFIPSGINLMLYDPAEGLPANLDGVHGLLIRTVNPINKQSLPTIPEQLEFIGTGSAGTDHVDQRWLQENQVAFSSAAGCNARSVAEYVATALLIWCDRNNQDLTTMAAGIVGAGHAGRQVNRLLSALGMQTVLYDPPREEREMNFSSATLSELLSSEVLTFHTPLTTKGAYPTHHWLDKNKLSGSHFRMVINAARGGVVSESALLQAASQGRVNDFILDVWEDEPEIRRTTARQAFIKTPHIAGYSLQAKTNASRMVAEALLEHFDLPRPQRERQLQPQVYDEAGNDVGPLSLLMAGLHPILEYDAELQQILQEHFSERGPRFNHLRAEFPLRQEFSHIQLPEELPERFPVLKALGFSAEMDLE